MEPGSIRFACSPDLDVLARHFAGRELPFEEGMVRSRDRGYCHVEYQPTVPGFRLTPETDPVTSVVLDYDATRFVTRGPEDLGDSLDVLRALLHSADWPAEATMLLNHSFHLPFHERARQRHFRPGFNVDIRPSPHFRDYNPWAQDFVKSGSQSGRFTVLVPRRLFEGNGINGDRYRLLLEHLRTEFPGSVASKLAWEGGDLMVVRDPRNSSRHILLHGDAAKAFWGPQLTPDEYAYVLRLEFGADASLNLGGLAPHIDFVAAFLQESRVALLATPLTGNLTLAREALASLIAKFGDSPPEELVELRKRLVQAKPGSLPTRELNRAIANRKRWPSLDPQELSEGPDQQVTLLEINRLLATDPERAGELMRQGWHRISRPYLVDAYLALIESQFLKIPAGYRQRWDEVRNGLSDLGFTVIEAPSLGGSPGSKIAWAGVSHVNLLQIGDNLFLPRFGFGAEEDALFEQLQAKIGPNVEITPIYAQHLLVHNGGIHCIMGVIRGPARAASRTSVLTSVVQIPPLAAGPRTEDLSERSGQTVAD